MTRVKRRVKTSHASLCHSTSARLLKIKLMMSHLHHRPARPLAPVGGGGVGGGKQEVTDTWRAGIFQHTHTHIHTDEAPKSARGNLKGLSNVKPADLICGTRCEDEINKTSGRDKSTHSCPRRPGRLCSRSRRRRIQRAVGDSRGGG